MIIINVGIWLFVGAIILTCFFHSPLSRVLLFSAVPLIGLTLLVIHGKILIFLLAAFIFVVVAGGSYLKLSGYR